MNNDIFCDISWVDKILFLASYNGTLAASPNWGCDDCRLLYVIH